MIGYARWVGRLRGGRSCEGPSSVCIVWRGHPPPPRPAPKPQPSRRGAHEPCFVTLEPLLGGRARGPLHRRRPLRHPCASCRSSTAYRRMGLAIIGPDTSSHRNSNSKLFVSLWCDHILRELRIENGSVIRASGLPKPSASPRMYT